MTDYSLADLRRIRDDRMEAALASLEPAVCTFVDVVTEKFSDTEWREYVRHLNAVWDATENKNFSYTFAVFDKAISILEARR